MTPVIVMKPKSRMEDYGAEFVNKTVLLKVSCGLPGFTRRLKKGNRVVKITSGDEALYKTQKVLLDSPEYEAVQKLDVAFRNWLYANFTQFSIGVFVIPLGMVELIEGKVKTFKAERKVLIKAFVKVYPEQAKAMKSRLRRGWNALDYPKKSVVRKNFFFSYNYVSFTAPGQLKGINPELFKREVEKGQALVQEAATEFKNALRVGFADMVKNLQQKLTDDGVEGKVTKQGLPVQKRIHDSAVKKLQEWVDTFDLRNALNDRELKAEVDRVRKLISGVSTEELRSTDTVRDTIRNGMAEVTAKLETLVEDAPIRKFKFAAAVGA